jgi:uridine kinase
LVSKPLTIGVAGGTGSGKTTVAMQLLQQVGSRHIAHLSHDAYYREFEYLTPEERVAVNFDHPDSLDTDLLIEHVLTLQRREPVEVPVYDFTHYHRKPETISVGPQPIILVEGILIFVERELRRLMDIKIFIDTDADIRFIRRMTRDMAERGRSLESVVQQYLETVRPMHLKFVEPSKRHADIIIPQGGYNQVAIDLVTDRIRSMLRSQEADRPVDSADPGVL